MLNDIIRECSKFEKPDSFFMGKSIPENFALPDNILLFSHDWFYPVCAGHSRYMLTVPAAPLAYAIDDESTPCEISPGQIMFSLPCQLRGLRKTSPDLDHGYSRMIITFDLPSPQYYLPDGDILELTPYAETCLAEMTECFRRERPVDLSIALFHLLREISDHKAAVQSRKLSAIVTKAILWINLHSGRKSDLATIADYSKTSVSNLRRVFRREMHESIGAFVRNHRIKVAEYNLRMTSRRIGEIAELCGFESVYAFSHFFRKHTGLPPGAYRRSGSMPGSGPFPERKKRNSADEKNPGREEPHPVHFPEP